MSITDTAPEADAEAELARAVAAFEEVIAMAAAADARAKAKPKLPPWNRPITDADRRAARAAIEAERAGDDGAIFRFIDTPRKD